VRHAAFNARVEHVEWVGEDGCEGARCNATSSRRVRAQSFMVVWFATSEHALQGGVRAHARFIQAQLEYCEGDVASKVRLPAQHEPPQRTAVHRSHLFYCSHRTIGEAQDNALKRKKDTVSESTVIK